ncbi:transcriptional regulator [Streptomyces sp. NPDC051016]|uniref:transcriptional regulator n=1 Tax=Streptomyces sp. NPDC051016 TaxID=3365638 RepID=UPI0037A20E94
MTVVETPPPLPVRDRTAAPDRAPGALSPMLIRLAEERATGVLIREHGTLHLAEGRVVHAESPLAPGLDVLLTAHGTLDPAVWPWTDDIPAAAHRLLAAGLLPRGALEVARLGALFDAGYFALAPSSTPGRFRYGATSAAGPLPAIPVTALDRETLRRRELLDRLWPDPAMDGAPLIRADPLAPPPVTLRQRAVLDRVDGVRTAPEIARELGRPAFHTLVDVRRLAAAGLLVKGRPVASAPPRIPPVTDPDIALLKRLRDALEAL